MQWKLKEITTKEINKSIYLNGQIIFITHKKTIRFKFYLSEDEV